MKFHLENIVKKARALREKGLSADIIAKKLGISESTVLRWCYDMPSQNKTHLKSVEALLLSRSKSADLIGKLVFNTDLYKIFVALLYWCEGGKYPSSNGISFANSDPTLVKTFLDFFRKSFNLKEQKLKIHMQIHSTHDFKKVRTFWSKLLKIPASQFYSPIITRPTKTMKRTNYLGTCTIRYYDVNILMEIMGIYEAFQKKVRA